MLDKKGDISQDFPLKGDQAFSINLSTNGVFYLYAGVNNNSLIKYRVVR